VIISLAASFNRDTNDRTTTVLGKADFKAGADMTAYPFSVLDCKAASARALCRRAC
jgi:hypothetical protein